MICWSMQKKQSTTMYLGRGKFVNATVVIKNVQIMLRKEGYVSHMVQRSSGATTKDVPIMPRKEEFVSDMVHRIQKRLAAMKDVPIKHRMGESVFRMVQT